MGDGGRGLKGCYDRLNILIANSVFTIRSLPGLTLETSYGHHANNKQIQL
jgi:hypothetical protein